MSIHSAPPADPAAEQADVARQLERRERTRLYVEECRRRHLAATVTVTPAVFNRTADNKRSNA